MNLIIPENLLNYEIYQQLKNLMDSINEDDYSKVKSYSIPEFRELLESTTEGLDESEIDFIYNIIVAQKGLISVLDLISKYTKINIVKDDTDYDLSMGNLSIRIESISSTKTMYLRNIIETTIRSLLWVYSLTLVIDSITQLINADIKFLSNPFIRQGSNHLEMEVTYE